MICTTNDYTSVFVAKKSDLVEFFKLNNFGCLSLEHKLKTYETSTPKSSRFNRFGIIHFI